MSKIPAACMESAWTTMWDGFLLGVLIATLMWCGFMAWRERA